MDELKKEYEELIKQRQEILDDLGSLKNEEHVIKFLELQLQNDSLYDKQVSLYRDIKFAEYDSCNHILVYSSIEHDYYEGRTYKSCGCIKCGLDESVKDERYLPFRKQIMYDYLKNHSLRHNSISTRIQCNIGIATQIYAGIIEKFPDIDDETAVKYFEIELERLEKQNKEKKLTR